MGPLRGVIDPADADGRRNRYLHALHQHVLDRSIKSTRRRFARALDFGCGTGRFLPLLSKYGERVYGVDRTPEMVEAARAYSGSFAEAVLHCQSQRLPFADDYFDLALSFCVLSVTARELFEPCLSELARVIEEDGLLLLYEKVCDQDGLTLEFYRRALQKARFSLVSACPARSSGSRFTALSKRWDLQFLLPLLAALECALGRYRVARHNAPYVEYLLVCEKRKRRNVRLCR